jgi:hypothetical protein
MSCIVLTELLDLSESAGSWLHLGASLAPTRRVPLPRNIFCTVDHSITRYYLNNSMDFMYLVVCLLLHGVSANSSFSPLGICSCSCSNSRCHGKHCPFPEGRLPKAINKTRRMCSLSVSLGPASGSQSVSPTSA